MDQSRSTSRRPGKFAPVSGAPSTLINVASFYFMLSAVLVALVTVLTPVFAPETRVGVGPVRFAISVALNLAWAGAYFWTGLLLGRASRRGGYLALAFILLGLLAAPSGITLAFTVLSFIVLASIWRDLK